MSDTPIKLTTTTPHSMFFDTEGVKALIPLNGYKGLTNVPEKSMHNIYLHGDLMDKAGFDIPIFLEGRLPDEDGVYPCEALVPDSVLCLMYLWIFKGGEYTKYRGLIVDVHDKVSREYAAQCLKERVTGL